MCVAVVLAVLRLTPAYISTFSQEMLRFFLIICLLEQALADFLVLETLRHGTHLASMCRILVRGGDPFHGGNRTGATQAAREEGAGDLADTNGVFHVFKDAGFSMEKDPFWNPDTEFQDCDDASRSTHISLKRELHLEVCKRAWPNQYKFLSGRSWLLWMCPFLGESDVWEILGPSGPRTRLQIVWASLASFFGAACLFCTTLRFQSVPSEVAELFREDPCYHGAALITQYRLSSSNLYLAGTLKKGALNFAGWRSRARARPQKFFFSAVQVALAALLYSMTDPSVGFILIITPIVS